MLDWWFSLIAVIIGFLFAWGVFELTEHRRRTRAQAAMRRALMAELGHAELVLSTIVFNLSIGADNVADAVPELRWFLRLGTERILRAGVLDLTTEELEVMRHLQGLSDRGAEEILRTLSPTRRARPLVELAMAVLDSVLANPPDSVSHIEEQVLRDVRWQVHLLATEARAENEWLRLTCMAAGDSDNQARVVANLDETREAYRRRAIVAVRLIRAALGELRGGQLRRTTVIARRARGRREPSPQKPAPVVGVAQPVGQRGSEDNSRLHEDSAPDPRPPG
jgi:hypothetical protein